MTKPLIINAAPQTADDIATIRKWTGADPKPAAPSVVETARASIKKPSSFPWTFVALTAALSFAAFALVLAI